jgi:hypothetical protein
MRTPGTLTLPQHGEMPQDTGITASPAMSCTQAVDLAGERRSGCFGDTFVGFVRSVAEVAVRLLEIWRGTNLRSIPHRARVCVCRCQAAAPRLQSQNLHLIFAVLDQFWKPCRSAPADSHRPVVQARDKRTEPLRPTNYTSLSSSFSTKAPITAGGFLDSARIPWAWNQRRSSAVVPNAEEAVKSNAEEAESEGFDRQRWGWGRYARI